MLEGAKFAADSEEELKEKWATSFHSDFVQWFKLSAPQAYEYRDSKKTLTFMLKFQNFSPTIAKHSMYIAKGAKIVGKGTVNFFLAAEKVFWTIIGLIPNPNNPF